MTVSRKFPLPGVELWKNSKNGFLVFQLHYTANPAKRSDDWRKVTSSNLTRAKFMQEYEITWETWSGRPVYPEFNKKIHTSEIPLEPERGLPLLRGWDFGLTPACIVAQLQGQQLVVLKEFVSVNMGIERFAAEVVLPGCKSMFPAWGDPERDWLDFIDPAGLQKAQTDERSCAMLMGDAGIERIFPGPIDWETRRSSVERLLIKFFRKGGEVKPGIVIDRAECPELIQGFVGGYRYPDKVLEIEPEKIKPIKNKYSHPHDAFQYLCGEVQSLMRKMSGPPRRPMPRPSYSFGK
jgi:hypothetical protein